MRVRAAAVAAAAAAAAALTVAAVVAAPPPTPPRLPPPLASQPPRACGRACVRVGGRSTQHNKHHITARLFGRWEAASLSPGQGFLGMVETFRPGLTISGRDEKCSTILIML